MTVTTLTMKDTLTHDGRFVVCEYADVPAPRPEGAPLLHKETVYVWRR